MSSRTVPRFAPAALLAAALAASATAQDKLPQAPMPRAKPANSIEIELKWTFGGPTVAVAPAPRPAGDVLRSVHAHDFATLRRTMGAPHPIEFVPAACDACPVCGPKDVAFVIGAGGLTRVMPMPEPPRFLVAPTPIPTGSFVVHGCSGFAVSATAVKALGCETCTARSGTKLSGTWYRDLGAVLVAVTFAGDEMTVKMTHRGDDGVSVTMTLTAQYTLTKDGLVHGAITGADVAAVGAKTTGTELADLSMSLQECVDHPFSFRAKMTPAGLALNHLKCSGFERQMQELRALCGMYTHAKDGKVPELKPLSAKTDRCDECRPPLASDKAAPERVGVELMIAPMPPPVPPVGLMLPMPAPLAPPLCVPLPHEVRPVSVTFPNDTMKQMAADAFQQLLPGAAGTAGMTLPSARYLEHYPQVYAPDAAFPLPRELAAQELPPATVIPKPAHVGTWVREIGSKRCVVKVAADHFTATVSEAHEVEGKTVTGHLTFTVDYHLARDGVTAVGLLTGVDVSFDGDLPDDAVLMVQKTGELQKTLENNPLALTLRVYADALVIGNVRMQTVGGLMDSEPAAYLGGRYRAVTEKALSPLKAVKSSPKPPNSVPTLPPQPSGVYGVPLDGFYSAPPGDLLPPQNLGQPARRPAPTVPLPPIPTVEAAPLTQIIPVSGITIPEPLPTMPTPTPPARVMPQPVKPGTVVPAGENRQLFDFSLGVFGSR